MGQIKVTPAEEDEVIVAGAVPEVAPEPEAKAEPMPEPEVVSEPVRKPVRKRDEAYRETTLEDLESGKMSTMQRVIIIAAVVCIIGAVVYYFVAMR